MSNVKIEENNPCLPHQQKLMMDFFRRRDERNEIILERLESPDEAKESLDKSCVDTGIKRVDFRYKGKSYWYHYGQWQAVQSYEWFPSFDRVRIILGVPWRMSGMDAGFVVWGRVTWSLWGGTPTVKQAERIWNIATKKEKPLDPWDGWEEQPNTAICHGRAQP